MIKKIEYKILNNHLDIFKQLNTSNVSHDPILRTNTFIVKIYFIVQNKMEKLKKQRLN